jgi:hypothetical protein
MAPRVWINDIRLGRIACFAEIAKREAQGERHIRLLASLAFVPTRAGWRSIVRIDRAAGPTTRERRVGLGVAGIADAKPTRARSPEAPKPQPTGQQRAPGLIPFSPSLDLTKSFPDFPQEHPAQRP